MRNILLAIVVALLPASIALAQSGNPKPDLSTSGKLLPVKSHAGNSCAAYGPGSSRSKAPRPACRSAARSASGSAALSAQLSAAGQAIAVGYPRSGHDGLRDALVGQPRHDLDHAPGRGGHHPG